MIADELKYRILEAFGHSPTAEQQQAIETFSRFMTERTPEPVMVMRGSAGTGKTTLAGAMVKALVGVGQRLVLLAPTGRAAKVFSLHAGRGAYTIHRRIYRQRSAGDLSGFQLNYNTQQHTLFIVDEASMIANEGSADAVFAGGCVLDDLIQYVYGGQGCRLMLIGDGAQLPPVGESEAPALSAQVLRSRGLTVYECRLDEVLRQSRQSGILFNATRIRKSISAMPDAAVPAVLQLPKIRISGFADISVVPGDELIETMASSYSRVGIDDTMVVTRSNKRANIYNQGVRNSILGREDELTTGDMVMVVKNNYYWAGENASQSAAAVATDAAPPIQFIANGDRAVVQRVRNVHELYGFRFADVLLRFPDFDDYELQCTVLLDTLRSEAPALTRQQQEQLYNAVMLDYADVPLKTDRLKRLRQDAHYNALQIKFAYAATCHKAQGGQWAHVYVDQGYMTGNMLSPDYIHWLYTAFTRATEQLYLVNWPAAQIEGGEELR